ncbi:MAG: hypothetical protein ACPHE1_05805, partial [Pseudomonadales bacterium]
GKAIKRFAFISSFLIIDSIFPQSIEQRLNRSGASHLQAQKHQPPMVPEDCCRPRITALSNKPQTD